MSLEGDQAGADGGAAWEGGGVACCAPAVVARHAAKIKTAIQRWLLIICINFDPVLRYCWRTNSEPKYQSTSPRSGPSFPARDAPPAPGPETPPNNIRLEATTE